MAPAGAIGWTHIWGENTQLPLSDFMAESLVLAGLIYYSPEDGPNARVYRLTEGTTLEMVKEWIP